TSYLFSSFIILCFAYRSFSLFFFHDSATTEIYTLSLHDALPISVGGNRHRESRTVVQQSCGMRRGDADGYNAAPVFRDTGAALRSEEHTSELQSRGHLVCRLLLEKKKKKKNTAAT